MIVSFFRVLESVHLKEETLKMDIYANMFSIVISCYNSSKYIRLAIESVISQTYQNWELLVVDDCSTDDSPQIIERMVKTDERIKYIKTTSPSGSPVLPRNIGIQHAKGRYIAFLDSDDMWLPNKLERQLKMFERYDDMAICFSYYEKMGEMGERNNRIVKSPVKVFYKYLLKGNVIGGLTAVYDTKKVGKMLLQNHSHEDYILWLDILKQGYVARNTKTVEALYRVRENSLSSNKLKALSWQWDIYRNVEKISLFRSSYYFLNYAYRAFKKALI